MCYEYADRVVIVKDGEIIRDCGVEDAFNDKTILEKTSLKEPFVYKAKRILKLKDKKIRNLEHLKEVIKNG